MPLSYDSLDAAQHAAVALTISRRLRDPDGDEDGTFMDPVISGDVRHSKGGLPWVSFGGVNPRWFRLMDIPPNPEDNYEGATIVLDAEGRPLGCMIRGPLLLCRVRGKWSCFPLNTGWNYEAEIHWTA